MKKVIGGILLMCSIPIFGMEQEKHIIITKEIIAQLKQEGFSAFIEAQKQKFQTGDSVTTIPIIGTVCAWGLHAFVGVDMDKARQFFARIEQEEDTVNAQLEVLEESEINLNYLNAIFAQLTPQMISALSTSDLSKAIEQNKSKFFDTPKDMYTTDENGSYTYDAQQFANYALCNLMAGYIVEQKGTKKRSPRQRRKK